MEDLKSQISNIWKKEIREEFVSKGFMWERHLQAVLYFHLRNQLTDIDIWIEPVFKLDGSEFKPDIVMTKGGEIISFIELKFKPWEFVNLDDINKQVTFEKVKDPIELHCNPIDSDWKIQSGNNRENIHRYSLSKNCLFVFAVMGKEKSNAFDKEHLSNIPKPVNYLQLNAKIEGRNHIKFEYD